jgi:hypothetical protein
MDIFNKISDLVDQEKKKRSEIEKQNIEKQRQNKVLFAKQQQFENDTKIYNDFLNTFKYGSINQTDKQFENLGKLSFEDCLQKAYCIGNDQPKGVCDSDNPFYPYIAWTSETAEKGDCLLGDQTNDLRSFDYNGTDGASVYITPIKPRDKERLVDNLAQRQNVGKINLVGRIKSELEATTRNLLHEKSKSDIKNDETIEDKYIELNGLDSKILTITQEIRQNTGKYLLNQRVSGILKYAMIIILTIMSMMLIYYSVKYTRNMSNNL